MRDYVCCACLTDHGDRDDAAACCGASLLVASGADVGVDRSKPDLIRLDGSPDAYERAQDSHDRAAARSRQRVIENRGPRGRF